ncbi:MAG: AAA family ATPase [bacterium]|nr:AAA family ATPase [bacterium]
MGMSSVKVEGYRPFRDFLAELGSLEVLVGANGSGKSSLFEFLRFLRDSLHQDVPPEIIPGSGGRQIFHQPGPERFRWRLDVNLGRHLPVRYEGELTGPVGRTCISFEQVAAIAESGTSPRLLLQVRRGQGLMRASEAEALPSQEISLRRPNQLALSIATNPAMASLYTLREYIRGWRFYGAFDVANDKIRKPVPVEQEPILHEDAGNLSALLHYLLTETPALFDELQEHLRAAVPGFRRLTVKARGGPGEVIGFWQEDGIDEYLSLADLSDGILRLLCWTVLCLQPNPPSLICIDEPDQGVHPRTLPLLGGLFEKACDRTQILLATHASYFLMQFGLERIAVLRKEDGAAKFLKPHTAQVLRMNLEDFGAEELELMHRNDELERLP